MTGLAPCRKCPTRDPVDGGAEVDIRIKRHTDYPVDPLFVDRWSPRAMSARPIDPQELMSLFEAARWAPSSNNNQPWRFVYGRRDTPHWDPLFKLLNEHNQMWVKNAAALIYVISKKTFDQSGKPSRTHSFDAGAAAMNLSLQGHLRGWVVHGMEGFNYDRAREVLEVTEGFDVEAAFAVGLPGDPTALPRALQARELPSERKPLSQSVFEGRLATGNENE